MWNGLGAVISRRLLTRSSRESISANLAYQSMVSHLASARDYAIRAVLEQEGEDGLWHVVAYGSSSLSGAEKNWSATEKECFAVVHFLNHWHHFLLGAKFEVLSDHQALSWAVTRPSMGMSQVAKGRQPGNWLYSITW